MTFIKHSSAPGKKQAPVPGPAMASHRKPMVDSKDGKVPNQGAVAARTGQAKVGKKARKFSSAFSSLKSRQRIVERVKRAIWASVMDINEAIINLALCGNYNAAKALFDFAGVYTLPGPEEAAKTAKVAISKPEEEEAVDPIDAFFRSIGVGKSVGEEPAGGEPQTEAA
ncbi:MAG TPA: hypothetical protein VKV02_05935 [Acidobacteriaceae bacterium]|nr:hypothetical protein [Acidobacteriaceae bacterium]